MPGPVSVHATGLDELVVALRGVDDDLLETMQATMQEVGDVVRDDARRRFTTHFQADRRSAASALSVTRSAENFETQTRGILTGYRVRTIVGQRLRKRTGKRADWGAEQMRYGLVPARDEHIEETAVELDRAIGGLLHTHGF